MNEHTKPKKTEPDDKPDSDRSSEPFPPTPDSSPLTLEEALRRALNTPPIPVKDIPKAPKKL